MTGSVAVSDSKFCAVVFSVVSRWLSGVVGSSGCWMGCCRLERNEADMAPGELRKMLNLKGSALKSTCKHSRADETSRLSGELRTNMQTS